jgi:hypothetical protein
MARGRNIRDQVRVVAQPRRADRTAARAGAHGALRAGPSLRGVGTQLLQYSSTNEKTDARWRLKGAHSRGPAAARPDRTPPRTGRTRPPHTGTALVRSKDTGVPPCTNQNTAVPARVGLGGRAAAATVQCDSRMADASDLSSVSSCAMGAIETANFDATPRPCLRRFPSTRASPQRLHAAAFDSFPCSSRSTAAAAATTRPIMLARCLQPATAASASARQTPITPAQWSDCNDHELLGPTKVP